MRESLDAKIKRIEKEIRLAVNKAKRSGKRIESKSFGSKNCICPITAVCLQDEKFRSKFESECWDLYFIEPAAKKLKCSYDNVWAFVDGFDLGTYIEYHKSYEAFYKLGCKLRKVYIKNARQTNV